MAESEHKKRKRAEGSSTEANKKKKVSISAAPPSLPPTISVSSVVRPKLSPPVLATTPGLTLQEDVQFYPYAKKEAGPAKKRKQSSQGPPKDLLLHSTSHRTLDYTAKEDRAKGAESLLKHYVAVFDPKSGDLKVIEARKMVVRGLVRSRQAGEEEFKGLSERENRVAAKDALGQAFGTKKAKKAIASKTENAIDQGRTSADGKPAKLGAADLALMDSIKGSTANMATREELQAAVDQARPVPKGHYDADDVEDVYNPKEIIGAEVLNAIPVLDWQEATRKGEPIEVVSRFVANRVSRVAASGENAALRLKILRYYLWLVVFFNSTRMGKERGTKSIAQRDKLRDAMAPAPEVVIENIRRKFSDNGVMRKLHQDLLFTHCCVFASIIDSFDVDTYDIKEDLKLEQKQINQYFQEIGARTRQSKKGDAVINFAKLSIPLIFPKLRAHRQR
ncbi:RNA polymerase I associated factor, A49-like protein [Coniochaeta sp. 2T2.1]|nr:RNA polymerase I associated factor, A49-like protein [Coniochaeta sp. 2T2.1]